MIILTTILCLTSIQACVCAYAQALFVLNYAQAYTFLLLQDYLASSKSKSIFRSSRRTFRTLQSWMSIPRKGESVSRSTVGTTRTVPSQISSINSLVFPFAKHTLELSTLPTLRAQIFLLV
jgi:hypothetical protein